MRTLLTVATCWLVLAAGMAAAQTPSELGERLFYEAWSLEQRGDFDAALASYEKLSKLEAAEPSDRNLASAGAARVKAKAGRIAEAKADVERGLAVAGVSQKDAMKRAAAYSLAGLYASSIPEWRKAAVGEDFSEATLRLANDLASLGAGEEAVTALNRLIARDPRDSSAWMNRCTIKAQNNIDSRSAVGDCLRAISLNGGEDRLAEGALAFAYLRLGRNKEAVKAYEGAIGGGASDDLVAVYGYGVALRRLGETAEGDAEIARALAMNPGLEAEFSRMGLAK